MRYDAIKIDGLKSVTFPILGLNYTSPYVVKAVDGLGPPEREISIVNNLYGAAYYQNTMPTLRNIVMRIGLNSNYATGELSSDLRDGLYWLFEHRYTNGNTFQIMLNGQVVAKTTVFLDKIDMNPFSPTPEVVLSMKSNNAYFQAPETIMKVSSANSYEYTFTTEGTANSGYVMKAQVTSSTAAIFLVRRAPGDATNQNVVAIYNYGFLPGDVITFDSNPETRSIKLLRGTTTTNLLGYLSQYTTWPWLDPEVPNQILTLGDGYAVDRVIFKELTYRPKYWGV